jgi:PAS domain S-box-containing protein
MDPVQEQRLKLALKAGRFGTWELDLSNRDLTSSDQCKANYGRSPSDAFTYENLNDSVHPEDRHKLQAAVQIGMNGGREFRLEYRCIWPDGSLHWIEVNGLVSLGADGKPAKMNGVTQEITGRKSIESELSAAKSTITSMLDTVNIATWTVNLSNNILTADRNMARMFFLGEEPLERPIDDYFEMIHPEDLPKVKAAMAEVFDDPAKGYKIEHRLLSPSKQIRWIDVRGTVERDPAGKAVMFRGVILDVTERKTAEELQLRLAVSQRLLALQEQERRRLGRELHDSAG